MVKVKNPGEPVSEGEISRQQLREFRRKDERHRSEQEDQTRPHPRDERDGDAGRRENIGE
jgi:hypothetical protein